MSTTPIPIKQHDTARTLTDTLLLDGAAIDITSASVVLVWKRPDAQVYRRDATIVDAETGQVSYAPLAADVEDIGIHLLEWEITFASGKILTVPTNGYIRLNVLPDLDDD